MATGLTNTICRDGQSTTTAVIPFASGISLGTTGAWVPTDGSGAGLVFVGAAGTYTKIGNMVFAQGLVEYPSTANSSNSQINGLPFTVANTSCGGQCQVTLSQNANSNYQLFPVANQTYIQPYLAATASTLAARAKNSDLGGVSVYFQAIYVTTS